MLAAACVLAATSTEVDPIAAPAATVLFGDARFTLLSPSLIRLEHSAPLNSEKSFDDRATSVVINRRLQVPPFTVTHSNASSVTITTSKLRLTYNEMTQGIASNLPTAAKIGSCGCSTATCQNDNKVIWKIHENTDVVGSSRTPSHPDGLTNQSLSQCFCACMADKDCEAIEYAAPGAYLAKVRQSHTNSVNF